MSDPSVLMAFKQGLASYAELSKLGEPIFGTWGRLLAACLVSIFILLKVFELPSIQSFMRRKSDTLAALDAYLAGSTVRNTDCAEVVSEFRDTLIFEKVTGIYCEQKWRSLLIALHRSAPPDVSWTTIRRARPFLVLDTDGRVSVRSYTLREQFEFVINVVFAWICLFSAAGLLALILFNPALANSAGVPLLLGIAGFVVFAMFLLSLNFPRDAVRRLGGVLPTPTRPNSTSSPLASDESPNPAVETQLS